MSESRIDVILNKLDNLKDGQARVESDVRELKTQVGTDIKDLERGHNELASKVSDLGGRFAVAITLIMMLVAGIVGLYFSAKGG